MEGRIVEHRTYSLAIPKKYYRKFMSSEKVVLEYNEAFDTLRVMPVVKFPTNLKKNSIVRTLIRARNTIRVTVPQEIADKWLKKSNGYVVIWEDEDAINVRPRQ
jgi:hypothetical protein